MAVSFVFFYIDLTLYRAIRICYLSLKKVKGSTAVEILMLLLMILITQTLKHPVL